MAVNFLDITYLKNGTSRQQQAFRVITTYRLMEKLQDFEPLLAGTIPLNIDIENSDLDIICTWENSKEFSASVQFAFREMKDFEIHYSVIRDQPSVTARFMIDDFQIEIFGQAIPVTDQMAYRHLLIEYKLLVERGEKFRQEIIRLKKEGWKTEPAFAVALGLRGDPYVELLKFE